MSITNHVSSGKASERPTRTGVARLGVSPTGLVTSVSTMTGAAHEPGCPDDDVPTTWSLCSPGFARGTTRFMAKLPLG